MNLRFNACSLFNQSGMQIKQPAKANISLRQIMQDIKDARTIERAKRANGNKARIPWAQVKKELQLD